MPQDKLYGILDYQNELKYCVRVPWNHEMVEDHQAPGRCQVLDSEDLGEA